MGVRFSGDLNLQAAFDVPNRSTTVLDRNEAKQYIEKSAGQHIFAVKNEKGRLEVFVSNSFTDHMKKLLESYASKGEVIRGNHKILAMISPEKNGASKAEKAAAKTTVLNPQTRLEEERKGKAASGHPPPELGMATKMAAEALKNGALAATTTTKLNASDVADQILGAWRGNKETLIDKFLAEKNVKLDANLSKAIATDLMKKMTPGEQLEFATTCVKQEIQERAIANKPDNLFRQGLLPTIVAHYQNQLLDRVLDKEGLREILKKLPKDREIPKGHIKNQLVDTTEHEKFKKELATFAEKCTRKISPELKQLYQTIDEEIERHASLRGKDLGEKCAANLFCLRYFCPLLMTPEGQQKIGFKPENEKQKQNFINIAAYVQSRSNTGTDPDLSKIGKQMVSVDTRMRSGG